MDGGSCSTNRTMDPIFEYALPTRGTTRCRASSAVRDLRSRKRASSDGEAPVAERVRSIVGRRSGAGARRGGMRWRGESRRPRRPPRRRQPSRSPSSCTSSSAGRLRFDTVERFSIADDETDVRELIVPCYVVDHPDGTLLWGRRPAVGRGRERRMGRRQPASRFGRSPSSSPSTTSASTSGRSTTWAFSHIHFDHVGVAGELTGGTWLVQQGDLDAAFPEGARRGGGRAASRQHAEPGADGPRRRPRRVRRRARADRLGSRPHAGPPGAVPGSRRDRSPGAFRRPLPRSGSAGRSVAWPTFNFDAEMTLESMEKVETFVAERNAAFWNRARPGAVRDATDGRRRSTSRRARSRRGGWRRAVGRAGGRPPCVVMRAAGGPPALPARVGTSGPVARCRTARPCRTSP